MKKILSFALVLTLVFAMSLPVLANNTTEITTTIDEAYTMIIPGETTITVNETSTEIGDLGLDATSKLAPNRQVTITASFASGATTNLINTTNNNSKIPYTLKIGDVTTNSAVFTDSTTKNVYVDITTANWNNASAGTFSDTITFTAQIGDISTP